MNSGISRSSVVRISTSMSKRVTLAGTGTTHASDRLSGQGTASPAGADCSPVSPFRS